MKNNSKKIFNKNGCIPIEILFGLVAIFIIGLCSAIFVLSYLPVKTNEVRMEKIYFANDGITFYYKENKGTEIKQGFARKERLTIYEDADKESYAVLTRNSLNQILSAEFHIPQNALQKEDCTIQQ